MRPSGVCATKAFSKFGASKAAAKRAPGFDDSGIQCVSTRVPPSFKCTCSVFGATKFPAPVINSARSPCTVQDASRPAHRPYRACVGGLWPCRSRPNPLRAEACAVMHQVSGLRAPALVLAGEDVGAGAADPTALHHGGAPPGMCHVPGQVFAAFSIAKKDKAFKPFRPGHRCLRASFRNHAPQSHFVPARPPQL